MTDEQWLSPDAASAWRSYLISNQLLMRALDRQLQRDSGIEHTHYGILVQLSERPTGSARVTELAVLMDHSHGRIAKAVTSLEREGLVRQVPDPNDDRMVHAVLTDEGREFLQTAATPSRRCRPSVSCRRGAERGSWSGRRRWHRVRRSLLGRGALELDKLQSHAVGPPTRQARPQSRPPTSAQMAA
ncbi:MarR family winged helix-turn-helix transcriptional regulator [Pseudonocardia sp. GCM10023141]|uniref:MarR family winged helix-turn-helix transcriptional regulator n=1 Tax=Pseudonocardia sp. GCM10023141 TaxID=3252653 RepID=UPI003621D32B